MSVPGIYSGCTNSTHELYNQSLISFCCSKCHMPLFHTDCTSYIGIDCLDYLTYLLMVWHMATSFTNYIHIIMLKKLTCSRIAICLLIHNACMNKPSHCKSSRTCLRSCCSSLLPFHLLARIYAWTIPRMPLFQFVTSIISIALLTKALSHYRLCFISNWSTSFCLLDIICPNLLRSTCS